MDTYGIIDIGSNTLVLAVYEIQEHMPHQIHYESHPVHLIDCIHDGHMGEEGIRAAEAVLHHFDNVLKEKNVRQYRGFITEPCRGIDNAGEMLQRFSHILPVMPLSGEQEAYYDWCGAALQYPQISSGIAFDIGGGSTELISFQNHKVLTAMSFPLGCVRLRHLPLNTERCEEEILKAREACPSLNIASETVLGIGGTVRAVRLLCTQLYHTGHLLPCELISETYRRLMSEDPPVLSAAQKVLAPSRIPVLLPGMHMLMEIMRIYEAEELIVSDTGIREGFLMEEFITAY